MSHILMAGIIGFFMGQASVDSENAGLFMEAMRCTLILFGSLNMLALFFGIRRSRRKA